MIKVYIVTYFKYFDSDITLDEVFLSEEGALARINKLKEKDTGYLYTVEERKART